ncbi:hypothetical protein [Thalassotalea ganghwensis]
MKYRRYPLITVLFVVLAFLKINTTHAEAYIECYKCSSTETKWSADAWAQKNVTQSEADRRIYKDVHIIDLYYRSITSYQVSLRTQPKPPPSNPFPPIYVPDSRLITTPSHLIAEINDLKNALQAVKEEAESLTIPKTILANAWESVNCAYCTNQINDYVNQQTAGKIATAQHVLEHFILMFGLINTSTPDTYIIPLEAGGKIIVKVKITNAPIQIDVKVLNYIDIDNNSVPPSSSKLKNMRIRVTSKENANVINGYINVFSLHIPEQTGTATITDCPIGPDGISPECPIDKKDKGSNN